MSMKDAPSPEDGTTSEESITNPPTALDFVENMTAYAVAHDAYKVVTITDFDAERSVGAKIDANEVDYEEALELPAQIHDDVMFIRVGQLLPSENHVVIVTTNQLFSTLLAEGFAYDHTEDLVLDASDPVLKLEAGDFSRFNEGDI